MHAEARLAGSGVHAPDEAAVDQHLQPIEDVVRRQVGGGADRGCRLECPAASEYGQSTQEGAIGRIEQVVAPGQRVAQRALTLGQIDGAAAKQAQGAVQPLEQARQGQQLHPRRG